jgi:hypothetical protein
MWQTTILQRRLNMSVAFIRRMLGGFKEFVKILLEPIFMMGAFAGR